MCFSLFGCEPERFLHVSTSLFYYDRASACLCEEYNDRWEILDPREIHLTRIVSMLASQIWAK
jgi:hypothetical protein